MQQIIHGEREDLKKRLADVNRSIFKIDAELKELKEANRKALENREEYHRSTLLDWFTSRESIFSSMNRTDTDGDCRSLVREITICVSEQSQKLSELRKEITAYTGNFSEDNVFAFKTSFSIRSRNTSRVSIPATRISSGRSRRTRKAWSRRRVISVAWWIR